jgi:hypothetical protein
VNDPLEVKVYENVPEFFAPDAKRPADVPYVSTVWVADSAQTQLTVSPMAMVVVPTFPTLWNQLIVNVAALAWAIQQSM